MIVSGLPDNEYRMTVELGDSALESLARSHVGEDQAARAARRISDPQVLMNLLRDPSVKSKAVLESALSGLILSDRLAEAARQAADPRIRELAFRRLHGRNTPETG